ncbi:hypothetical protein [Thermostaphylospora chromogena]|uniref:Enoyl reductase n=1 Tax=Thermostaphylospora chromogena TaxID=35622 RepID=A0A1H1EG17_9ACTN|nr:hypothetical protein [Thermostaphylospora chromogena]SDQ87116.1 enoyl reductase [Thermostaphylospora chromogena]
MSRRLVPAVAAALLAGLALPATPAVSAAPGDPDDVNAETFQDGRTVGVVLVGSRIRLSGSGVRGERGDGFRVQSPCWYEPFADPETMLRRKENESRIFGQFPGGGQTDVEEFLRPFREKAGEDGHWWRSAMNARDPNALECFSRLEPFVFVPANRTPPAGITRRQLADIARAALTVPEPRIRLNPDGKSYVNLPTFVWLDGIGETTRSVTATLPGIMSVTVVARLREIRIDAGTDASRAEVREDCGPTGRPYREGAEFTCGVRYLRSSADQPRDAYTMTVTTVWPVEIADDAVPAGYEPVEVEVTREVTVGEVQSTVERSTS